ncbi:MAG: flagellar biosynthesis protein FlhB [Polaribacter sp.]|jgi:flagellar biosynthesis protein FlhB
MKVIQKNLLNVNSVEKDIKDKIVIAVLYVLMFISICAIIQCLYERHLIIKQIEMHEAKLKELLTKN